MSNQQVKPATGREAGGWALVQLVTARDDRVHFHHAKDRLLAHTRHLCRGLLNFFRGDDQVCHCGVFLLVAPREEVLSRLDEGALLDGEVCQPLD